MILCLDTNVVADLLRRNRPLVRRGYEHVRAAGTPLVLSLIVWHELIYGVRNSPEPVAHDLRLRTWAAGLPIEPLDERDIEVAADVRAALKPTGRPIGAYDLLIAGQALARGWTVVTANHDEFSRVEGLTVIDWSKPASLPA